jgi:hypothetical protein
MDGECDTLMLVSKSAGDGAGGADLSGVGDPFVELSQFFGVRGNPPIM